MNIDNEEIIELGKLEWSLMSEKRAEKLAEGINFTFCNRCGLERIIEEWSVVQEQQMYERTINVISGDALKKKVLRGVRCQFCMPEYALYVFLIIVGESFGERNIENCNYYAESRQNDLNSIGVMTVHDVIAQFQKVLGIRGYYLNDEVVINETICDFEAKIMLEVGTYWLENEYKMKRVPIRIKKYFYCRCSYGKLKHKKYDEMELMTKLEWSLHLGIRNRKVQEAMNYTFCKRCDDAYFWEEMSEFQKNQVRERKLYAIVGDVLKRKIYEIYPSIVMHPEFVFTTYIRIVGECYGENDDINRNYYVQCRVKDLSSIGIFTIHEVLVRFQEVMKMKRFVRENEDLIDADMCEIEAQIMLEAGAYFAENEYRLRIK